MNGDDWYLLQILAYRPDRRCFEIDERSIVEFIRDKDLLQRLAEIKKEHIKAMTKAILGCASEQATYALKVKEYTGEWP